MHKLKVILAAATVVLSSCNSLQKVEDNQELYEVVNAYGGKTKGPTDIYYKAINQSLSYPSISWKEVVKKTEIIIDTYSQSYMDHWISTKDSILRTGTYSPEQQDSIISRVNEQFELEPWTLLTPSDRRSMLEQLTATKGGNWNPKKLNSVNISRSKIAARLSKPLFTKDRQLALLFVSGAQYEAVEFYKKEDEEWEFYCSSVLLIE